MLPFRHNKLTPLLVLLFFMVVLGYAYFEGKNVIRGPEIIINTPEETFVSPEQKVAIQGLAERIVELRLNGRPVSVTEAGAFYEEILLAPGYNELTFTARDKAGREAVKKLQVVYEAGATTSLQQSPAE